MGNLRIGSYVQVGRALAQVTSISPLECRLLARYHFLSIPLDRDFVVRDRSDFCPLILREMTDMELEARAARLEELCPDLED